jgi:hypothetical protein
MRWRHLISILLLPVVAAGCLHRTTHVTGTAATTVGTTTEVARQMHLTVFRVDAGKLAAHDVQVPQSEAVAAASLKALGIDANVTISGGTATVDLPDATPDQVAEVVYTLTQYPSVRRVDVGGRTGLTRADVAQYLPPISIELPPSGATVSKTFHVVGTAMVFEATFVLELKVAGKVAVKNTVTASEGAPNRGFFDVTLTAPATGPAELVAYEPSAENGSPLHTVTVPLTVG